MHPFQSALLVLFCLCFAAQECICADSRNVKVNSDKFIQTIYTVENGLPQTSATSIVQTRDGYIWIATFGGLSRFDGIKFTNYNTGNTPQLVNNRLTVLYEDRYGVLWIGSEDGDIIKMQNGEFSLVKRSEGTPFDNRIYSMLLDQNDVLWFTSAGYLKGYNTKSGEFVFYGAVDILETPPAKGEDFQVFYLAEDTEKTLWFTSSRGLIRFQNGKFTEIKNTGNLPQTINTLAKNPEGGLWVGSVNSVGLFKDLKFSPRVNIHNADNTEYNAPFFGITADKHLIFPEVLADKTVIYELNGDVPEITEIKDLVVNGIRTAFVDNEGNFWIGFNHGLIKLKKRHIFTFSLTPNEREAQAIIEDLDKTVWITSNNKLIRFQNDKFEVVAANPTDKLSGLAYDKQNTLWVGTHRGIAKFENNKLIYYNDENPTWKDRATNVLFFDNNDTLWIGKRNSGLQEFKNGEVIKTYTTAEGLAGNSILRIFKIKAELYGSALKAV